VKSGKKDKDLRIAIYEGGTICRLGRHRGCF